MVALEGIRHAGCQRSAYRMPFSQRKTVGKREEEEPDMYDRIYGVIQSVDDFVWGWGMICAFVGNTFIPYRTDRIYSEEDDHKRNSAFGSKRRRGGWRSQPVRGAYNGACIDDRDWQYYRCWNSDCLRRSGSGILVLDHRRFGIATKYAESLIAVKYRVKTEDGRMQGGAMYALERGLNMRWLGLVFAFLAGFASFGIGCATQVNAIAEVCNKNLGIDPLVVGVIVAGMTAVVIFGGIKSIAKVCEKLVPFMAAFYVIGCVIILLINYDYIIPAVTTICRLAFTKGAAAGGLVGGGIRYAIQYGVARGLFSNESGLGSAPIAAAAAKTKNPVRQALVSSTGTFWDTVVVCLMTGLVLVTTIMKNPAINVDEAVNGGELTTMAFGQIPFFGSLILVVGIISFAYSTILGWAYYGERCVEYFAGKAGLLPYRILYVAVLLAAPVLALDLVWKVADILNALMAIPNLIAVLLLSPMIVKETKKYIKDLDAADHTPGSCCKNRKAKIIEMNVE